MQLYRLVYVSDVASYIDWTDLKDILLKSQENNAQLDVTGFLVMISRKFLQVLEGPAEALNMLYAKILRDSRHDHSRLLTYMPISERHFSEWAMQGISLSMMKSEFKDFLIKKYGHTPDGGIVVPEDPFLVYSLLYDIYTNSKL